MYSSIDAGFATATLTGDVVHVGDSGWTAVWNRVLHEQAVHFESQT